MSVSAILDTRTATPTKPMEEDPREEVEDSNAKEIHIPSPNHSEGSTVDVEMNSPSAPEEREGNGNGVMSVTEGEGADSDTAVVKEDESSSNNEDDAATGDDLDDFPPSPTPPPLTIEPSQPPSSIVSATTIAAAAAAAASNMSPGAQALSMAAARQIMFDNYTPWVMRTYGDSAKTKTITTRKYARIVALLKSLDKDSHGEPGSTTTTGGSTSEAAKFRLWVKSKGFHLGPPVGHPDRDKQGSAELLYLPTGTDKTVDGKVHFVYKRVAMVEQFFDIIYSVHVEAAGDTQLRGRAGKHCGQKRTYRAVADQFAFIPREAISKFLLHCIECQRKNSMEHRNGGGGVNGPRANKQASSVGTTGGLVETEIIADSSTRDSGEISAGGGSDYRPLSPAPSLVDQLRNSPFAAAALNGSSGTAPVAVSSANSTSVSVGLSPPTTPSCTAAAATTLTPSTAAAFSQAMAAMQSHQFRSLQMRNSLLHATASQNPLLASQAAALLSGDGTSATSGNNNSTSIFGSFAASAQLQQQQQQVAAAAAAAAASMSANIDLSLPITNTYLRRMRALGLASGFDSNTYARESIMATDKGGSNDAASIESKKDMNGGSTEWNSATNAENQPQQPQSQLSALLSQNGKNNGSIGDAISSTLPEVSTVATGPVVVDNTHDDSSSAGAKEDEEDEEDEEDKLEGGDPEKLKAFNMFVRLFVDENLDRMVPISKQPKEKIQAIIDSCTRQFPEHATKARKRIRTYLKSCRRNKRTRDQAGLDGGNSRTTPHLTSVQAEHLLARACENEAENAKRMRMGLEPVSQPMPAPFTTTAPVDVLAAAAAAAQDAAASSAVSSATPSLTVFPSVSLTGEKQLKTEYKSEQLANLLAAAQQQQPTKIVTATPVSSTSIAAFPTLTSNGIVTAAAPAAGLYRSSFQVNPNAFPGTAALLQQGQQATAIPTAATTIQNGPTTIDGLKKPPLLSHKLNSTEMGAVRQLITGYRESAAFLLRSADELEHLLQIQPKL